MQLIETWALHLGSPWTKVYSTYWHRNTHTHTHTMTSCALCTIHTYSTFACPLIALNNYNNGTLVKYSSIWKFNLTRSRYYSERFRSSLGISLYSCSVLLTWTLRSSLVIQQYNPHWLLQLIFRYYSRFVVVMVFFKLCNFEMQLGHVSLIWWDDVVCFEDCDQWRPWPRIRVFMYVGIWSWIFYLVMIIH